MIQMEDFSAELARIEQEIAAALPRTPRDEWKQAAFGHLPPTEQLAPLIEPTRSLVDLGGKRWRPLLLVLCAEAWKEFSGTAAPLDMAYHLVPLVENIHTASLIHDDIEDRSDSRRGQPAAYLTYGLDTALNAGSWLYFQAMACIDTLPGGNQTLQLSLYRLAALHLRRLHLGQAMDISWHRQEQLLPVPSQADYQTMVRYKTGTLASLAAATGALSAGADWQTALHIGTIAENIGVGFQILDDVLNLTRGNPGKKRGDDIVEGKKSLPVILFAEQQPAERSAVLQSCFATARREGIDSEAVTGAIDLLLEGGTVTEARTRGIDAVTTACRAYKDLFGSGNKAADKITALFSAMIPPE